jgi:hypothetical protein
MKTITKILDRLMVDDWRRAWTWLSAWAAAIPGILSPMLDALQVMPMDQQAALLVGLFGISQSNLVMWTGLLFLVARLIRQRRADPSNGA